MSIIPKVSIIMSVYNGDKYLNACIDSIRNQSYDNFEFIIVNDGSNDKTKDILESFSDPRLNIIHQKNIGLAASLNRAILLSKGKYIARQDADDISLPGRLEKQVEFLENNKDHILVGSNSILINEIDEQIGIYNLPTTDTEIRWNMLFRNPFCHTTVMIRSDIMRSNRITYSEHLKTAQDFELWSKVLQFGKSDNIEEPLVEYRVHPDQLCKLYNTEQQENALLISQSNLANLGFKMSEDEVKILRKWSYVFPASIQNGDISLCNMLLRILKKFKLQPYVDINCYKNIKNDYIRKVCNAINMDNINEVLCSSLLINMLCMNSYICFNNILKRLISKVNTKQ